MKGDIVTHKPNIACSLMPSPVITLSGMSMTESAQVNCIATISKREGEEDRMSEKRPNGVLVITDDQGCGGLCAMAPGRPAGADPSCGGIRHSSDAYIPFRDNIDRASRSNVKYVAQTGGSTADEGVTEAADEYGMVMTHTGLRMFLHQGLIR